MCASPVRKNANFSRNSAYAAKFSAYGNRGLGEVLRIMPQGMRLKGFFPFHELLHHGRVVVRTRTHGYVRLYARLLLVYRQINLKSVGQGLDACLHRVALNGLVVVG